MAAPRTWRKRMVRSGPRTTPNPAADSGADFASRNRLALSGSTWNRERFLEPGCCGREGYQPVFFLLRSIIRAVQPVANGLTLGVPRPRHDGAIASEESSSGVAGPPLVFRIAHLPVPTERFNIDVMGAGRIRGGCPSSGVSTR